MDSSRPELLLGPLFDAQDDLFHPQGFPGADPAAFPLSEGHGFPPEKLYDEWQISARTVSVPVHCIVGCRWPRPRTLNTPHQRQSLIKSDTHNAFWRPMCIPFELGENERPVGQIPL